MDPIRVGELPTAQRIYYRSTEHIIVYTAYIYVYLARNILHWIIFTTIRE